MAGQALAVLEQGGFKASGNELLHEFQHSLQLSPEPARL